MQNSIIHMPLDLTKTQHQWQIECIRGNTAREIHLRLHTKGVPFIITTDMHAVMIITKPDKTKVINDCMIKIGESEVVYEVSSQAVSATGLCSCQLHLSNGVKTIATPVFNMYVSTRNLNYEGLVSQDDLNSLINAIAQAENLDCKVERRNVDGREVPVLVITDRFGNETTALLDDIDLINSIVEDAVKNKADINHNHDDTYSKLDHNHDGTYALIKDLLNKADINHNHDGKYITLQELLEMDISGGGGGGNGLTALQIKELIGQLIAVGNEPITDFTEIIADDDAEEVELPTTDEFNSVKKDVEDNTSARHTHSNKSVLDGITAAKVAQWDSNSGGNSGGSSVGATAACATLEQFGGIAGDTSATARAANTKAVTDAILAGYNIKCEGGITSEGVKTYSFSGVVDVRAIKYRSIDIDLNGCRFSDFHIIANVIDDSAMTETSCSWAWTNGNKFYLAIHDGLIGASTSSDEMTSMPSQPVAITGLIPRFYNLQVIGKVHICAMPPIYCDQMYFENIKLVGSADSVWEYWDNLDNICLIVGKDSNGYIFKNNGDSYVGSDGKTKYWRLNGDQFRFEELNDCRHFFTLYENLGTIVNNCIASSFTVKNSVVRFVNCHNESGTRRTPLLNSVVRGGYTDVILDHCYMEQHAFETFTGMSDTVLGCVSMIDCEFRIGVFTVAGHSDQHACNFLEALYKMKYQHGNKISSMDRYILPKAKVPSDVFCIASTTPNISTNSSLTKVATGVADANFKPGTYAYTVAYHNACALQAAVKTETKSVTISAQATLNRFAIENYGGQMISLYKSDGSNTYRAIVPSYPTVGTFTLMLDDCGAFVSIWNYNTRTTADASFARETMKDAVLWELVSSKPTISVNSNIRSCGSTIYDTSGKLYSTNGNSLTAIN